MGVTKKLYACQELRHGESLREGRGGTDRTDGKRYGFVRNDYSVAEYEMKILGVELL